MIIDYHFGHGDLFTVSHVSEFLKTLALEDNGGPPGLSVYPACKASESSIAASLFTSAYSLSSIKTMERAPGIFNPLPTLGSHPCTVRLLKLPVPVSDIPY
jgi:hypothetical protein